MQNSQNAGPGSERKCLSCGKYFWQRLGLRENAHPIENLLHRYDCEGGIR